MSEVVVGVIGGSGLYDIEGFSDVEEVVVDTPFGAPSDAFIVGRLEGVKCVFLPRHGRGHRFTPSEVNYRANIWGMKKLGAQHILSVSAVGSLKEEIEPGHLVCVNQFVDRTRGRVESFFGDGIVGHVQFGDPVEENFRQVVMAAAQQTGAVTHDGGAYVHRGPTFRHAPKAIFTAVGLFGRWHDQRARWLARGANAYTTLALCRL